MGILAAKCCVASKTGTKKCSEVLCHFRGRNFKIIQQKMGLLLAARVTPAPPLSMQLLLILLDLSTIEMERCKSIQNSKPYICMSCN